MTFILPCNWLLNSCQFESDDIFEDTSITPATPPEIEVRNLEIGKDSIFLYQPIILTYSFHAGVNTIYGSEVFIDGTPVATFESGSGEFLIDPKEYFIGYHTLNIKVYTNSNSGSIADIIGREGYVFESHNWTFFSIFERTGPRGYTSMVKQNGALELHWDSCHYLDINYFIEKHLDHANGPLIDTITSPNPTYTDQTYAGEEAVYKLYVTIENKPIRIPWGYFTIKRDIPIPELKIIQDKYILNWSAKAYFPNLKGFRISDIETGDLLFECANSDTSVYLEGFRFGQYRKLYLTPVSNHDSKPYLIYPESYSSQYQGRMGIPVKHLRWANSGLIFKRAGKSGIFFEEDNNVKTYDVDTRSVADSLFPERQPDYSSIVYEASLSSSRDLFCILSHSHNALFYGNSNEIRKHKTFDLPFDMLSTKAYIFDDKDEIILWAYNRLHFLSMSQNRIVDTLDLPPEYFRSTVIYYSKFSPDGQYYTHRQGSKLYMFRFDEEGITKLYELENKSSERIIFHQKNKALMFYNNGSALETRRIEDFSLESSIPLQTDANLKLTSVNFQTNQCLVIDETNRILNVHDLEDGSTILSLPAAYHKGFALMDNSIYYCQGALFEYNAN